MGWAQYCNIGTCNTLHNCPLSVFIKLSFLCSGVFASSFCASPGFFSFILPISFSRSTFASPKHIPELLLFASWKQNTPSDSCPRPRGVLHPPFQLSTTCCYGIPFFLLFVSYSVCSDSLLLVCITLDFTHYLCCLFCPFYPLAFWPRVLLALLDPNFIFIKVCPPSLSPLISKSALFCVSVFFLFSLSLRSYAFLSQSLLRHWAIGDWDWGLGDWGLRIRDWGLGIQWPRFISHVGVDVVVCCFCGCIIGPMDCLWTAARMACVVSAHSAHSAHALFQTLDFIQLSLSLSCPWRLSLGWSVVILPLPWLPHFLLCYYLSLI